MYYHLLKPHMFVAKLIQSTCIRITSHTYVHVNTYFISKLFKVYFKEFGEHTYGRFTMYWYDYYIPVHTGSCSCTNKWFVFFMTLFTITCNCFNNHENMYCEDLRNGNFHRFFKYIVFDLFRLNWTLRYWHKLSISFSKKHLFIFFNWQDFGLTKKED